MKLLKCLVIIIFFLNFNSTNAQDNDLQNKIIKNLRCLICQGQSVYDSDSDFANSLKILVERKLNDGFTEKQIYSHLNDKYCLLYTSPSPRDH